MKTLLDMNLSPVWVEFLKLEGFEAVHWSDVGDARAADATIMSWARQHGFVVITHDLDFSALLAATEASGSSVVQLRTQDLCRRPWDGTSSGSFGFEPTTWSEAP